MASELIEEKLKQLPDLPGCYLMKNQEDEIIYSDGSEGEY